ncbi:Non-specific lipid transfer protein GPI-anchored 1 [Linum perenne]
MVAGAGENLGTECAKDFQSVMTCLAYAQGKQGSPSKECCDSIKSIKDNEPKCLCFIMQQTHNGSAQFKSMGIQESKLLQLPTACQLHNATISFCPRLSFFLFLTYFSTFDFLHPFSTTNSISCMQVCLGCLQTRRTLPFSPMLPPPRQRLPPRRPRPPLLRRCRRLLGDAVMEEL